MSNNLQAKESSIYRSPSKSTNSFGIRLASIALAIAGVLFVIYPALRPFSDETSMRGAQAFASTGWIVAHVLAIVAFILLTLGLFGLYLLLKELRGAHRLFSGVLLSWLGVGLTLPFYGAETFGLHAIGKEVIKQNHMGLIHLADDIRMGSGFILIAVGLGLLAIASIIIAVAIWKSHVIAKWSGIPFMLGFILYLPQFLGTQPIRIMHGLMVMVGCIWIAVGIWKSSNMNHAKILN